MQKSFFRCEKLNSSEVFSCKGIVMDVNLSYYECENQVLVFLSAPMPNYVSLNFLNLEYLS